MDICCSFEHCVPCTAGCSALIHVISAAINMQCILSVTGGWERNSNKSLFIANVLESGITVEQPMYHVSPLIMWK